MNDERNRFWTTYPALLLWIFLCIPALGQEKDRQITKLADGIYAIQHANGGGGNTTVIIGEREVFVVDSTTSPSAAREDIAQIRQWTQEPVRYLLNTHFHNDHNNGNKTYMDAYPGLAIIAEEETRRDMDLIQPGNIERNLQRNTARIAAYEAGKDVDGRSLTDEEKKQVQQLMPVLERRQADYKEQVYQPPTLTFTDKLSIDVGNRQVEVLYLGRGNTAGDAIVYLPKEKIIASGDLLVYPLPYTFDGYPSEWVKTLQRMAQLDAEIIVPGHGPVFHDKTYLFLMVDLFKSAIDQVRARIAQLGFPGGYSVDKVKDAVNLNSFRAKFTGNDEALNKGFDDMTAALVKITFSEAAQR